MKLMAFAGSPRKGGNTDTLIDKVIEGAKSNAEVGFENSGRQHKGFSNEKNG